MQLELFLLNDLIADLPQAVRLQRLVVSLRQHFNAGAVALLRLEGDTLHPVAADGLVQEVFGRRFTVSQHPRLSAILARRELTVFDADSHLPDPYDGLIEEQAGEPLPVHECMGLRLHIESRVWGVLTLDTLAADAFISQARQALEPLRPVLEAAIRMGHLEQENQRLRLSLQRGHLARRVLGKEPPVLDTEIVGQSPVMQNLLKELLVVAQSDLPVLFLGETGVGKELFARYLQQHSRRADKVFVQINCAALPESLAESEFFGHVRGAFSGAVADRAGRFESAHGGTLFLDEVGELPLAIQAKLLRVLQNGEIQRLGSDSSRKVNVRLIAATNRPLHERVRDGAFRADLYHRLSVYPVHIPALRERGADVLLLAGRFLELNRSRLGLRSLRLAPEAQAALLQYAWPGNVRELEHVISRAALKALSRGAQTTDIVTLPVELLDLEQSSDAPVLRAAAPLLPPIAPMRSAAGLPAPLIAEAGLNMRAAVENAQRLCIAQALEQSGHNWAAAARALDLDASNLHKLAQRLGLK